MTTCPECGKDFEIEDSDIDGDYPNSYDLVEWIMYECPYCETPLKEFIFHNANEVNTQLTDKEYLYFDPAEEKAKSFWSNGEQKEETVKGDFWNDKSEKKNSFWS
ncbi:MAG: hypothetical protein IJT54_04470 [Candidatus Methanomethylophilaceae archaeon]|nr:hypothetical protein [Candidatus Methanomethylophilaceae archaeon]